MIVCIAEKPSVAREIARIIGATASRDGYIEGNGYQVTWTYGHLCTLKEPHDYTEAWKPWTLSRLPMIPQRFGIKLIHQEHIEKQFAVIEKLFQAADAIVNCGDAGQEGELIQRWVMQKAGAKCPVKRLWISSMTDEAIAEGFQQLKDQDDYQSLYLAGVSRAIGDWLLGMNATRLYTLKYGQNHQVLSIGRVQTPTLALIVNRQKEIEQFKPEAYWILSTTYRDTVFTATKGKFTKKEEGEEFLATISGKPFTITEVQKKNGTEQPPQLYDLTSLQVDCNKKYSMSAEQTLNIIQGLYEKKLTTYPRVDTQYLSDDIYPKCPQTLAGLMGRFPQIVQPLNGKVLKKSKRVFDSSKVTDHLHDALPISFLPVCLPATSPIWRIMSMISWQSVSSLCSILIVSSQLPPSWDEWRKSTSRYQERQYSTRDGELCIRRTLPNRQPLPTLLPLPTMHLLTKLQPIMPRSAHCRRLSRARVATTCRRSPRNGPRRLSSTPRLRCCVPWRRRASLSRTKNCAPP